MKPKNRVRLYYAIAAMLEISGYGLLYYATQDLIIVAAVFITLWGNNLSGRSIK